MFINPSLHTVFWVLAIRCIWFFFVTVRGSLGNKYTQPLMPLPFYNVIYAAGEALLFFYGFYTNLSYELFNLSYQTSEWVGFGISASIYVSKYQLIKHIKLSTNIWDFANSKLATDEAKCEHFIEKNYLPISSGAILFHSMIIFKLPLMNAIIRRQPELLNARGQYCYLGFSKIFSKSENMLEAYILGSTPNQFYCRPEVVDAIVDSGTFVSEKTKVSVANNTVFVESPSELATIKLILNKVKVRREIIAEADIPLEIRQKTG